MKKIFDSSSGTETAARASRLKLCPHSPLTASSSASRPCPRKDEFPSVLNGRVGPFTPISGTGAKASSYMTSAIVSLPPGPEIEIGALAVGRHLAWWDRRRCRGLQLLWINGFDVGGRGLLRGGGVLATIIGYAQDRRRARPAGAAPAITRMEVDVG